MDFTNRDTSTPILIEAVILDAPEELFALNKYGEYYQLLKDGTLTSDIEDENADQSKKVLKVRLFVDDSLMPQWMVVSDREIGEKVFAHGDRAKLNMFMISDYVNNHFAYSKGSPLYSTLRKVWTKIIAILQIEELLKLYVQLMNKLKVPMSSRNLMMPQIK